MDNIWLFALGFTGQALFASRTIVQWFLSEKAKKVVSPTIFWQLSLVASMIFLVYGWLRGDFAVILGQIFAYYIYIWNLRAKGAWVKLNVVLRFAFFFLPIVALFFVVWNGEDTIGRLFKNESVPLRLLLLGSTGQVIFTFRFIYQWLYSRARHESLLPTGFWVLSIVGSGITVIYALLRQDPVLIIGQGAGVIAYARNLWLIVKEKKRNTSSRELPASSDTTPSAF